MIKDILISSVFVLDQDEALDFYVGKLGFTKSADVDFGPMRWLTVKAPGSNREVLLEKPGAPGYDEATAASIREMVSKGAAGGHLFLTTDDAKACHAELKAKGVELPEEPIEQPYGLDFGLRDPFGNHIRIAQRHDGA